MNIPDRWIALLDMLSDKDLATLMRAVLHGEEKPTLTGKNQSVADLIYGDIAKTKYFAEAKRKSRKKFDGQTIVKEMSNDCQRDVKEMSIDSQTNVKQEERKEGVPPCSPLPLPPTPPITNPPIIPPSQEKREEALTGVCAGAGACEDEQIPFEGFEPLDPPDSEVKHRKPTIGERFEALWAEYPKKSGKKNAFESYQRAIAAGVTDETIADGIKRYKDYIAVKRTSEQYILAGSTYFYQWRWQDIYDTVSAAPTCSDKSGGDEFLNYLNEELEKEKAKRESRWTEQT